MLEIIPSKPKVDIPDDMAKWAKEHKPIIPPTNDTVHHPAYYCKGDIECLDAIEASMTPEAFRGFCKGCILKYLWRYEQKGWIESLEKARFYIDRLIRHLNEIES